MRQRIELTGTNSSIVLIALISNAHRLRKEAVAHTEIEDLIVVRVMRALASFVLGRTGGFSGGPVPDPISNSAVKLPCANGTKSQDLEE